LEAHLALAKLCHIDHQLNKALHLGICLLEVLLANIERAFEGHEEFFNMIQNVVQWILVFMASLTRQEIIDLRSTFSNKILNLALPNGTDLPSSLELLKCCFMPHIDSAHRALSDELEINSDEEQDMGNFMLVEITLAQCADDSQQAQRLIQDNESIACIRELLLIGLRQQRDKAALKTALTRAIADIDNPNDYQNALYVHDWREELSRL
jgi:hypothetical protein